MEQKIPIDKTKSFRYNLDAGVTKKDLMEYYCIDSEEKWDKIMSSIKTQQERKRRGG